MRLPADSQHQTILLGALCQSTCDFLHSLSSSTSVTVNDAADSVARSPDDDHNKSPVVRFFTDAEQNRSAWHGCMTF
eukprot:525438-Pelagomonas_calceolata.AAC.4